METIKIIKIGGNIINDELALDDFLVHFSQLKGTKILVHGGGNTATSLAEKMKVPVKKIDGRRITDSDTLDIITMVYAGKINKHIIAKLQSLQCNAVGFTGADGNTIISDKRPVKAIDYGFVGDIKKVETTTLQLLLNAGITPVFCAITHNEKGQLLNTNADTIASELAIAFAKTHTSELYYCFEKKGVLESLENEDSVIESINTSSWEVLKKQGVISEGMLPKLQNCFNALNQQVAKICIGKPAMLYKKDELYTTITNN